MNLYQQRVLEGRKEFLKLNLKQEQELLKIYEEAGKKIGYKLSKAKPGSLTQRYLEELDKSIEQYVAELRYNLGQTITDGIEASSQIAAQVQLSYMDMIAPTQSLKSTFKNMFTILPDKVVKQLISANYYDDGKTLSKRLWNITSINARDIDTLIKVNVAMKVNARELAKELEAYINPKSRIEPKTLKAGMSKKISYQAQRLSRTSLSHANRETYSQGSHMNPFCTGLRWNLNPYHYERQVAIWGKDICDKYAEEDGYGLGSGVFPIDKLPISHPNCLCYTTQETVSIEKARAELIRWVNGENNKKLDDWLERYGKEFGIEV